MRAGESTESRIHRARDPKANDEIRGSTDNRKIAEAGGYDFSEHMRISVVAAKPKLVAEHHHFPIAEFAIRRRDESPHHRLCSEGFQIAVLNVETDQALGLLFGGAQRRVVDGSNVLEHAIEVAPGNEVGHGGGDKPGIVQPRFMDHDEPVYVWWAAAYQPLADD
jgi:hypothetical protein